MTDQPAEESAKDWMEIWYETSEITWQKPLSPEANQRILDLYQELVRQKEAENDGEGT